MFIHTAKLEHCFRKVKQIFEHRSAYCLAPDRLKMSVEDLQFVIADMYDLKIEKREVAFDGTLIRGMVERYSDGRARILVRKNQEEDWLRFVTVKELCQLAISENEDWSAEGEKTLDSLLYEFKLEADAPPNGEPPQNPTQSERIAEVAAIELMYPHKYRADDLAEINAGTTTIRKLAVAFHVPEYVLDERFIVAIWI